MSSSPITSLTKTEEKRGGTLVRCPPFLFSYETVKNEILTQIFPKETFYSHQSYHGGTSITEVCPMSPGSAIACYFQSSIRVPLPILKSVTNQVVWIPPPATTIWIAPALEKGLINVSGDAFKNVAKGSRP